MESYNGRPWDKHFFFCYHCLAFSLYSGLLYYLFVGIDRTIKMYPRRKYQRKPKFRKVT